MKSYCNCFNGKRQTALCVHREMVEAHADDFPGLKDRDEEPDCFLACLGFRGTMCFSVATDLMAPRRSRHKRCIVMKEGDWKCMARQSCPDRNTYIFLHLERSLIEERVSILKLLEKTWIHCAHFLKSRRNELKGQRNLSALPIRRLQRVSISSRQVTNELQSKR